MESGEAMWRVVCAIFTKSLNGSRQVPSKSSKVSKCSSGTDSCSFTRRRGLV